jgi:hypothetical protein
MDYLTGNQFLTLNDYKNIEFFQNEQYNQIGGEPSSTDIAICIGILILYVALTILTMVYFNKNKTSNMSKNEIINKNGLFVLLTIIFILGILSSLWIGNTTIQISLISGLLCAIGLSTDGIFYLVL